MVSILFPGRFDPIHNGHIDIVLRAAELFSEVIVEVYPDGEKPCLFSQGQRLAMVRQAFAWHPKVSVVAKIPSAPHPSDFPQRIMIGLRAFTDFDHTFTESIGREHFASSSQIVTLFASEEFVFLSSSLIKEIAALSGDVQSMVPEHVERALSQRFAADN
jgi:pantetheine-phosphate adenylyltransferase